jgi:hypothetical protein
MVKPRCRRIADPRYFARTAVSHRLAAPLNRGTGFSSPSNQLSRSSRCSPLMLRRASAPSAADRVGEPSGSLVVGCQSANPARSVTFRLRIGDLNAGSRIMARTLEKLDPRHSAARVRTVPCNARQSRSSQSRSSTKKDSPTRKVPSITITGAWLRAAGFKSGKPCYVRAFARKQLVICQSD